jgi:hypothetical protein
MITRGDARRRTGTVLSLLVCVSLARSAGAQAPTPPPPAAAPPAAAPPATAPPAAAPPAAVPPAPDNTASGNAGNVTDEAEIQRALQADQAAQAKNATAAGAAVGASTPTVLPAPAATSSELPAATGGGRSFQSLNPDVSAIVDLSGGGFSDDARTIKSGDDPQSTGFKAQEVELALQQVVDPYFRADIFLTIPNLSGLEVEEAFLTTTALPGNFQIKAGVFRAGLGRQNAQHLHLQDFTRRPAMNAELLGIDGLRAPGVETNWLVPGLPFYLVLAASAFSVDAADADQPLQTFGGGTRHDFTYVGSARAFFPLSESTSLYAGLSYARGDTSQSVSDPTLVAATTTSPTPYDGYRDNLYGGDVYLKWKPANQAETYASVAWQTEYFVRQIPDLAIGGVSRQEVEGGGYSQVVVQTHRRLYLGVRGELMGLPSGDNIKRERAGALSVTWALSEFARIRLYGELRHGTPFTPLDPTPLAARTAGAAFLQLEAAIGAHGAHPF